MPTAASSAALAPVIASGRSRTPMSARPAVDQPRGVDARRRRRMPPDERQADEERQPVGEWQRRLTAKPADRQERTRGGSAALRRVEVDDERGEHQLQQAPRDRRPDTRVAARLADGRALAVASVSRGVAQSPRPSRDDVALDLGGARVERAADRVAQVALDLLLGHVAVAAEDLHGVEARLDEALGDVQLGDRRLHASRPACVLQRADAIDQRPAGVEPHLHVHDPVGDRLELADRLAELLARARVLDALLELPAHRRRGSRQDAAALPFHRALEDLGAAAFAAEAVGHRDAAVLEDSFRHRRRAQAHLVEIAADGQPRRLALDDEAGDAHGAERRIDRRVGDEEVGDRCVGDERLGAVEHVVVAVADGAGPHARRCPSRHRLAGAVGADERPSHRPGRYRRRCSSVP